MHYVPNKHTEKLGDSAWNYFDIFWEKPHAATSCPSHMDFSHLKALQMLFNANAQPYDAIFATYIIDAVNLPEWPFYSGTESSHHHEQHLKREAISQSYHDAFFPLPPAQHLEIPL